MQIQRNQQNSIGFSAIKMPGYSFAKNSPINDSADLAEYLFELKNIEQVKRGIEKIGDKSRTLTIIRTKQGSKKEKSIIDTLLFLGAKEVESVDVKFADDAVETLKYRSKPKNQRGWIS